MSLPLPEDVESCLSKLAGEMASGKGMPSSFLEDWNLPGSTPAAVRRKIVSSSDKADGQCRDWAVRLRDVILNSRKENKQ